MKYIGLFDEKEDIVTKEKLETKQDKITGAATTITDDNLTASHALVSDANGKVAVSTVTLTELGYLDGVTSNVQTQLNKKLEKATVTSINNKTGAVQLNASDVGALPNTTVIPTKTSQLDNDSGFITSAPVTSVNAKTGAVTLSAADVSAIPSTLTGTAGQVLTKTADGQEWKDAAKELPSVTTADNGKFLRVVNGAWAASEIANANGGSF